jgi:tol-pal system protein YbgF
MNRRPDRRARRRAHAALALVAGVVTVLTGCASGGRAQRESEIAALRSQVDELRRGQEASTREVTRLAGEVSALSAQSALLAGEAKAMRDELARVKAARAEDTRAVAGQRSSIEDVPKPSPALPMASTAPGPSPASGPSPERTYAAAMANFQAEEYGQAVLEWTDLSRSFPGHPLAANAQYWIAEAYYRQRDFRQALIEFRTVINGHTKSQQVPEAWLKVGLCHRALEDPSRAREAWEHLTAAFPATSAAAEARALLAAAGAGARPRP